MTNEQFDALVRRLEKQARDTPSQYRFRVFLFALLGNAYLGVVVLLVLALLFALAASIATLKILAVKLALIIVPFLWLMVRAVWVKIPPPTGIEVTARQAPELFAMIGDLRGQLRSPQFDHVLIDSDFNAGVVQVPRMGVFGWPRNYLLIGLPLMKVLTRDQLKSVLAHEFGHLAGGHGKLSNWIYCQRKRWSRLVDSLDASDSWGNVLIRPFLKWFAPNFNAYSFPLARANEYEADATSVRLTSPQTAASALTSVDVLGSFLTERYWPQIHKLADQEPKPSMAPYFGMGSVVSAVAPDDASVKTWLDQAVSRQTSLADTHPALSDRLKAIGESPSLAFPTPGQASDLLLGSALPVATEQFDEYWKSSILPSWEERYLEVQKSRQQLADLDSRVADGEELSVQDALIRAKLTEAVSSDVESTILQFRTLRERVPEDLAVCFGLGFRLLRREDSEGLGLIEQAMQKDDSAIAAGCEVLRDFWRHKGDEEQAKNWHQRLVDRLELEQRAAMERNQLVRDDSFDPHGLSDIEASQLHEQLKDIPGLRTAYLLKKRVKHLVQCPCYVLGFSVTGLFQFHNEERASQILRRIQATVTFPGETIILNVDGGNRQFGRKFKGMGWSKIF